jgi:hypothetical protein
MSFEIETLSKLGKPEIQDKFLKNIFFWEQFILFFGMIKQWGILKNRILIQPR